MVKLSFQIVQRWTHISQIPVLLNQCPFHHENDCCSSAARAGFYFLLCHPEFLLRLFFELFRQFSLSFALLSYTLILVDLHCILDLYSLVWIILMVAFISHRLLMKLLVSWTPSTRSPTRTAPWSCSSFVTIWQWVSCLATCSFACLSALLLFHLLLIFISFTLPCENWQLCVDAKVSL